jgi:hypothetical protein
MATEPVILRMSRRVPLDGVNLAWITLPQLDPEENVNLIEAGRFIAENLDLVWTESLGDGVVGVDANTDTLSGLLWFTIYNAAPSGAAASGALTSGAAYYNVPRAKTLAVLPSGFVVENFTSEIRLLHPVENSTHVWRMRVQDGVIVRRYVLRSSDNSWLRSVFTPGDQLVCYYSIPEILQIPAVMEGASAESYNDFRTVDVSGMIATLIDDRTLQLPDEDLFEIRGLRVNSETLVQALSGFLTVASSPLGELSPPRGPFTSWDPERGTLTLSRTLSDRDEIRVDYRYREHLLTYEGYLDDFGVYHDLDFNPSPGHAYDRGRATSELLNIPIYIYALPTAAYREIRANGVQEQERRIYTGDRWTHSFLRWERTAQPVGNEEVVATNPCRQIYTFGHSYFGSANYVEDVPVEGLTTASSTGRTLANFPSAAILGKVYVTPNSIIDNVSVLDTRTRGGGVPREIDITDPRLPGDTRRTIETYWDESGWDGASVPLGGVVLVELPSGVLDGENGYTRFPADYVEEIVRKALAAGIKPVIRYV